MQLVQGESQTAENHELVHLVEWYGNGTALEGCGEEFWHFPLYN